MRPLRYRFTRLLLVQLMISFPAVLAAQAWETVAARGRCPAGTLWQFWIHRGRPDRLLFYLEGGGACWTPGTCDLKGRPAFDPIVNEEDNPANADGILKLDQPANPFRGWSVVFVPYCTADVHLGTRTVTYEEGITIDHRGAANVRDALAWVKTHLPGLTRITVAGGSAGAIPTPVYATRLAGMYPKASVTGIGDGAGGYRSPAIPGILTRWGVLDGLGDLPAFAAIDSSRLTFESLYIAAGKANPKLRLAQINGDQDAIQLQFLTLLGITGQPLAGLEDQNLNEISAAVPTFRRYTIPTAEHTVLTRPSFYTTTVNAKPLTEWVAELIR